MIDKLFLFRLLLSFVVGGVYIVSITRISELLGPKIGGVISTLPSTALIGMIFLGLTEGVGALPKAAPAMLVGFGVSLIFLMVYAHLRSRNAGVAPAAIVGIVVWLAIMACIGLLNIGSFVLAFVLFLACFLAAFWFFRPVREITALKKSVTTVTMLARAVFAGAIVASTVLLARLINPMWGGIAAAFPALYLSSIIILERQQSKAFTLSVLKHLSLGSFSLAMFGITIGLTAPHDSLLTTIVISTLVSVVLAIALLVRRTRPIID